MMDRFCTWLADSLGTNTAIAAFVLIAFVPLWFQLPKTVIEWQSWLSQTCIQLVALAVLQKGTRLQGDRSDRMLKETHDAVMQEMGELKTMHHELHEKLK